MKIVKVSKRRVFSLTTIYVNGRKVLFGGNGIVSYSAILSAANMPEGTTVVFTRGPGGHSGVLGPGGRVKIVHGMVFDAVVTTRA